MILSIISIVIAVISAIIALNTVKEGRRISKLQLNIQLLHETEQQLKSNPELLKLHGIDIKDLEEIDVTSEEFVYILNSFRAGQAYAHIHNNKKITITNYRRNFLDNPKVKQVWDRFIRDKFLIETSFTTAINDYYQKKILANDNLELGDLPHEKSEKEKAKTETSKA